MLSGPVRMLTCEMVVWGQTVRSVGPFAFPKARCIVAFFCKADVLFTSDRRLICLFHWKHFDWCLLSRRTCTERRALLLPFVRICSWWMSWPGIVGCSQAEGDWISLFRTGETFAHSSQQGRCGVEVCDSILCNDNSRNAAPYIAAFRLEIKTLHSHSTFRFCSLQWQLHLVLGCIWSAPISCVCVADIWQGWYGGSSLAFLHSRRWDAWDLPWTHGGAKYWSWNSKLNKKKWSAV